MELMASCAERVLSTDPGLQNEARAFLASHETTFRSLLATAAVRRLEEVSQLGVRRNTKGVPAVMMPLCDGRRETEPLKQFNRLEHSQMVAGHMLGLCLMHGVSGRQTLIGCLGSLLHDVGHAAYSHLLEGLLVSHGCAGHESRGVAVVRFDPEITAVLGTARVEIEAVVAVIEERGKLGMRQKLVDTLAYLWHDGESMGLRLGAPHSAMVMRAVGAVREDGYEVGDRFLLEDLLERRALFHAAAYEHPLNRVLAALLNAMVEELFQSGRLTPEAVARGTDAQVLAELERHVSGAPRWFVSAFQLVRGRLSELKRWEVREMAGKELAFTACEQAPKFRPSFAIPPHDATGKTVRAYPPDGSAHELRAAPSSRPEHHRHWHVLSYHGPA